MVVMSDTRSTSHGVRPDAQREAPLEATREARLEVTREEIAAINREAAGWTPQEVLSWAFAQYSPGIALACSFGGASGMALLDMSVKINPAVQVFYLDTGFLFPETYALVEEAIRRYGIDPVAYQPRLTPQAQARQYGDALWRRDPDLCCQLRKVDPHRRALEGKRAWISGIRRDQTSTRRSAQVVEWDTQFGLVKVNPLASWSEAQVWGLHPPAPGALEPPPRPGLPQPGLHPLHPGGEAGGRPPGGPVVRDGQGGVRAAPSRRRCRVPGSGGLTVLSPIFTEPSPVSSELKP